MSLHDRLNADLKAAMRAKDVITRDTLRMVLSAAKYAVIEKGEYLTDGELESVVEKEVKKRKDSSTQFAAAGRQELADKEDAETAVLIGYLPEKMSPEETRALVEKLIGELGISSKKEMGKLMKALSADYKGKVDMRLVQTLAGELL
ncbi:MAG: hypothetical protein ACI8QS_000039 [Planctomycetota bacterium]|jgi:uncharacterized protein YqeY